MKLVARLWLCSFSPPSNWQGRSFNGRMVWSDQTEGWTQLQRGGICLHVSNHAKLTSSTILHWKNRAISKHEKPNGWGSPGPNTNTDHLKEDSLGRYCLRPLKRQKERWSLPVFGPGGAPSIRLHVLWYCSDSFQPTTQSSQLYCSGFRCECMHLHCTWT